MTTVTRDPETTPVIGPVASFMSRDQWDPGKQERSHQGRVNRWKKTDDDNPDDHEHLGLLDVPLVSGFGVRSHRYSCEGQYHKSRVHVFVYWGNEGLVLPPVPGFFKVHVFQG